MVSYKESNVTFLSQVRKNMLVEINIIKCLCSTTFPFDYTHTHSYLQNLATMILVVIVILLIMKMRSLVIDNKI